MRAPAANDPEIHVVIKRVTIIKHNHGPSTRREHPVNLADGSGRIRCMVKYSMGINEVEGAIREGQVFRIALHEASFQVCQLKTPPRYTYCLVRQVDRGVVST